MAQHSMLDDQSIEAWIAENSPNGEQKLEMHIARGNFAGPRANNIKRYIAHKKEERAAAVEQRTMAAAAEAKSLRNREIVAAEKSADHTGEAAKWAKIAVWISLAAFALSAWPYISKYLAFF
jgi:hypothetical protein